MKKLLMVFLIIISFGLTGCSLFNKNNDIVLECVLKKEFDTYQLEYQYTFTYEEDVMKHYKAFDYVKFEDTNTGENFFKFVDGQSDSFNKYEGVEYKVTFNAKNELRMRVSIDVSSAPEAFVAFIDNEDINEHIKLDNLKEVLEEQDYTCK